MTGLHTVASAMLVAVSGEAELPNFPLSYRIACIILAALFVWTFRIAREPRRWRRRYQAKFTRREDLSVNRNKRIDEKIKKHGITVSMVFLVAAVSVFVLGVTYRQRHTPLTQEDKIREQDMRWIDNAPKKAGKR